MALTANLGSTARAKMGAIRQYNVGSLQIWRFATVVLRSDGLAYPAIEDVTDTYKQIVVGWALEEGAPGKTVRVRGDGALSRNFPDCSQSDIGKLALIKDDETVQGYTSETGQIVVGRNIAMDIEGESMFVDFTDRPMRVAVDAYS